MSSAGITLIAVYEVILVVKEVKEMRASSPGWMRRQPGWPRRDRAGAWPCWRWRPRRADADLAGDRDRGGDGAGLRWLALAAASCGWLWRRCLSGRPRRCRQRSAWGTAGLPGPLAVAAGTHGLLTAAAEDRPLLVLVDDMHWLDPVDREALLFAVRRLGSDAIACVMTLREGVQSTGRLAVP